MPAAIPQRRQPAWQDASLPLTAALPPIPGDPPFARRLFLRQERDGCEAASLCLSAHAGTHIDFPAHFFPHGKRAGDYPVSAFFLPAVVVDCGQALRLGPQLLDGVPVGAGEAVLFRTVNSAERLFFGPAFPATFAAATPELARACLARGLGLVGLDAMSIEPLDDQAYPVHHILLGAGIRILEGLFLADIAPGRYLLACPPPHLPEAEAAPVRAVLGPLP